MSGFQRIVKYFGFALAALIIVGIVSLCFNLLGDFVDSFSSNDSPSSSSFRNILKNNYGSINRIEIEISRVDLIIENGDRFNIETSNKYISTRVKDGTLYVLEESHNIFKRDKGDIIMTIPSDKNFEFFSLESGAASINIEKLNANTLMLKLGAGKTSINNLFVNKRADIDGGAGNITIMDGIINNLDLDMGVGNLSVTSSITGDSKIDCGIGNLKLNLKGYLRDYVFNLDKGIGNIKINGENIKNIDLDNTGDNTINVNGGIGNINITTIDDE